MSHNDPRTRRHPFLPPVDALAAAVRLEVAADAMRETTRAAGPAEEDPPTGIIDLAAIRAAVAAGPVTEPVSPAAAAWLAGASAADALAAGRIVESVAVLDQRVPPPRPAGSAGFVAPEPVGEEDPEEFCPDCFAGMESNEHHEKCVAPHELSPSVAELMAEIEAAVAVPLPAPTPGTPLPPADGAPAPALTDPAPLFDSEHPRLTSWRSRHDPRSRAYGVRAVLGAPVPVVDRLWFPGLPLDQQTEGCCVGAGIVDALNAVAAADTDRTIADARALYRAAQRIDQLPDSTPGTSVLAGLTVARRQGWISGYRWCFGTRDIAQAVLTAGPVVIGIPWYAGMAETAADGLVTVSGAPVGGHCVAVVGIRTAGPQGQSGPFFVIQNSWGAAWGDGGLGYVHHHDLARLLAGVGEAALPTVAR